MAERFRNADRNGDGVIDAGEARTAGFWFQNDLKEVDNDNSGTVTIFELGQALQRRVARSLSEFDAADTNRDGKLSDDEISRAPTVAEVLDPSKRAKDTSLSRPEYESYAIDRLYRDAELKSVVPNIIDKRF